MDAEMNISNLGPEGQYINLGAGNQNIILHNDRENQNKRFLQDLKLTDPWDDKDRIQRTNGGLLRDSYLWVLENKNFKQWQVDDQNGLLWIRGDPGKGKTMLLCGIIDELQRQDPNYQLAHFFCQATDINLNTASAVLRGLLYTMIGTHRGRSDLIERLRETHGYHGRQLFEDANGWDVLCRMTTSVLSDSRLQGITLVIDALDECTKGLEQLLEFIVQLPSVSAKVIVSSRNWPMIERGLARPARKATHINLDLNERAISEAIASFIRYRVGELAGNHKYDSATRDLVHKRLTEGATDTFLWAALVCRQLANINVENWNVGSILNEFPAGLHVLYARMLGQALSSKMNASLVRQILAITLTALRPVELSELKHLLGPSADEIKDERSMDKAVRQCGSFLTVRNNVVYFVHQSAKDYLSEVALETVMPYGRGHEHNLIWSNSLRAMSRLLRRDIHNLKAPGALVNEIEGSITELVPLQYSWRYWIDHFCISGSKKQYQFEEIEKFFKHSFLHWVEAASLLKSVDDSIGCIVNLSRTLKDCEGSSKLDALVQDACHFLQYHRQGIENASLQVYHSALIFSPTSSMIRKLYQHEEPAWVVTKPVMEEAWSPLLQRFDTAYPLCALSLVFSPDGNMVAACSRTRIKIWDAITGRCLRTIRHRASNENSDRLPPVAFSPDGGTIASASGSVGMLYNVATGQSLRELHGHQRVINDVDFSKDGTRLVSASDDGSVKLWNPETGQCLSTLAAHSSGVISAIFSPNGQTIATVSKESKSVKGWNSETGKCLRIIETDSRSPPKAITFLQDGIRLVVACRSGHIEVWNMSTGQCLKVFMNDRVYSLDVCPKTAMIVSHVTGRGPIRLWDIDTGRELGKINDNIRPVEGLSISPDGTRLATSSRDGIMLWDLTVFRQKELAQSVPTPNRELKGSRKQKARTPEIQYIRCNSVFLDNIVARTKPRVLGVAISTDCKRVVSISTRSFRSFIDIWTTQSGRHLERLQVHKQGTRKPLTLDDSIPTFSTDGKVLIARAYKNNIEIWNATEDSRLRCMSEGGRGRPKCQSFSSDAMFLATAWSSQYLRIWNIYTGQCIRTFDSVGPISRMGFSESGAFLYTDVGAIDLKRPAPLTSPSSVITRPRILDVSPNGYHVQQFKVEQWIMKGPDKLISLSNDYRAQSFAARKSTVALGLESGKVAILRFR